MFESFEALEKSGGTEKVDAGMLQYVAGWKALRGMSSSEHWSRAPSPYSLRAVLRCLEEQLLQGLPGEQLDAERFGIQLCDLLAESFLASPGLESWAAGEFGQRIVDAINAGGGEGTQIVLRRPGKERQAPAAEAVPGAGELAVPALSPEAAASAAWRAQRLRDVRTMKNSASLERHMDRWGWTSVRHKKHLKWRLKEPGLPEYRTSTYTAPSSTGDVWRGSKRRASRFGGCMASSTRST
ncbi:diguanylate cyclase response regulator [Micractinium conductrix]|uniref:Diguanylate cyclase response regulator n=1 Tax=Micractinium conductrix TaxID=554055 RepID=A0A2P6VL18_9CHLO|nr:diguanylate cyclase response regulator [Micractinium conductrix]|eukprot:PSC74775.1 diguanylate cyclase response regulator [Micractinium conductrix]